MSKTMITGNAITIRLIVMISIKSKGKEVTPIGM